MKNRKQRFIICTESIIVILCFSLALFLFLQNSRLGTDIAADKEKISETETETDIRKEENEKAQKELGSLQDNDLEKEYELWLKRTEQLKEAMG